MNKTRNPSPSSPACGYSPRHHTRSVYRRRRSATTAQFPVVGYAFCRFALVWLAVASAIPSAAQTKSTPKRPVTPLARFAPGESRLFISASSLRELLDGLKRANAESTLDGLPSSVDGEDGSNRLLRALTDFVGLKDETHIVELSGCEIAFIAPSWARLGDAVLLLRIPDESLLDRWFPTRLRRGSGDLFGASFFHVEDGLLVCTRERTVAMARRWGSGSLFDRTMRLFPDMPRGGAPTLAESPSFQELVAYLPSRPLALLYIAAGAGDSAKSVSPSPWFPRLDRAAVGLYEGRGRLEIALQGHVRTPHRKPVLTDKVHDRLLQLPQDSLLAVATTIDLERAFQSAAASGAQPGGILGRYLTRLVQRAPADAEQPAAEILGPHLLVCWGHDLGASGTTPQLALLVQVSNESAVLDLADRIAGTLSVAIGSLVGRPADGAPSVADRRYLGEAIHSIPLADLAARASTPLIQLSSRLEPSWTVSRGWLIISLTGEHLERILDAQTGLSPTLAFVPDVRTTVRKPGNRTVVALAQPDLTTGLLQKWLHAHSAGAPSLLDPAWWRLSDVEGSPIGGLSEVKLQSLPPLGVVAVEEVDPQGRFHNRLQPEDWIIGVDGRLLSLTNPAAELESRLREPGAGTAVTLRVHRDETAIDVTIPPPVPKPAGIQPLKFQPAEVIAELIQVGRALQFASFESTTSDEEHYSARISLRFTPRVGATETSSR